MSEAYWHLVSYDVRADDRRRRVARLLEGYGERVQCSVFRIHSTPRNLIRIRWELARVMDDSDNLLIIPIPDAVARRIQGLRDAQDWEEDARAGFRIVGSASTGA